MSYTSSPGAVHCAKGARGGRGQEDINACGAMSCFTDQLPKARFARLPAPEPELRQKRLQAGPPLTQATVVSSQPLGYSGRDLGSCQTFPLRPPSEDRPVAGAGKTASLAGLQPGADTQDQQPGS